MAKDVVITPLDGDIQFENSSGTEAGKIEQSGDDLVLSNAVGDILIGDGTADVYIGDGTNNVDIVFEQNGSIRGEDGSSVDITLGSSDTDVIISGSTFSIDPDASFSGTITVTGGAIKILRAATDQNTSADSSSVPDTTGAEFLRIGSSGTYSDGRYTHEWAKVDRGGNLSLYLRESKGTANAFSNIVRFGNNSYNSETLEVFGTIGATNLSGTNTGDNSANTHSSLFIDRGSIDVTTTSGGSNTNPFDDAHTETKVSENGMRTLNYTGASAFMYTFNNGGSASVVQIGAHYNGDDYYLRTRTDSSNWRTWKKIRTYGNTTLPTDFVSAANGGTFSGALKITDALSEGSPILDLHNSTNTEGAGIRFTDTAAGTTQFGNITYRHADSKSYGSGASFTIGSSEGSTTILADGKLMYNEGIYSKPATGTGAGTRKDSNWDSAYTHSQTTHAPANAEQNVQSDWNETTTTSDAFILNKPTVTAPGLLHRQTGGNDSASIGPGWISVAYNVSSRRHGEVIVSDSDSGDHAFIRIDWMRSYADSNFTVLNVGGHANRITGVRVLSEDSDNTYGTKILQVYVTAASIYGVRVHTIGTPRGYTNHTSMTPILENTKTGYTLHGNALEDLDTSSLAAEEGLTVGGNIAVGGTVDGVDISALPTSFAPTDAEANVQADWTETTTTSDAFILNKPTIPTDFVSKTNGGTFSGDITISKTDPTITLVDSSGANTDPNGTIIFSEVSGTQNFDINYNGASDRLEFRGLVSNVQEDLVLINRDLTNTLQVLGGATFAGDVTVSGDLLIGNTAQNPKKIIISQIGASLTENTALMLDGNGEVVVRNLGSNAFNSTTIPTDHGDHDGLYLPIGGGTLTGNLNIPEYLSHAGDTNTYLRFRADDLQLVAGGRNIMRMDEGTDPDKIQLGDSTTVTYTEGKLGIGTTGPSTLLHTKTLGTSTTVPNELRIESVSTSGYGGESILNLYTSTYGNPGIYFGNQAAIASQPGYIKFIGSSNQLQINAASIQIRRNGQGKFDITSTKTYFSSNNVGIKTTNPSTALEVSGTTTTENLAFKKPTADNQFRGEIVTFGSQSGIAQGDIVAYNSSGQWVKAQANSGTTSKNLLGVAMGTTAAAGILLRGFVRDASFGNQTPSSGQHLYLSTSTAGDYQTAVPSTTGHVARVIGYSVTPANEEIYFCPDNTFVEIA